MSWTCFIWTKKQLGSLGETGLLCPVQENGPDVMHLYTHSHYPSPAIPWSWEAETVGFTSEMETQLFQQGLS
jgi:hypothetical protein